MDRELVHQTLLKVGGDVVLASSFLSLDKQELIDYLTKDPVLSPTWSRIAKRKRVAPTDLPDLADTTIRESSKLTLEEQVTIQDNFLLSEGLEGCGMTKDQISKAKSFAAFAGKNFEKMVDMGHGMLAVNALKLHERAEEILENILNNEEEVSRTVVTPKGEVVTITEPKYSQEDKIKWQKALTDMVGEMRKISDSAVNAQSVGQKIGELMEKMQNTGGRQPKRLKPAPKVNNEKET
tara:strand:- start:13951 stop:14661 length:711 start_codon:yes stop_codon:yes gene_type:complete